MLSPRIVGFALFLALLLGSGACTPLGHERAAPTRALEILYQALPSDNRVVAGHLLGAPYAPCPGVPPIPDLPTGYCDASLEFTPLQLQKLRSRFLNALIMELGRDPDWDEPIYFDDLRKLPDLGIPLTPLHPRRADRLHAEGIWELLINRNASRAVTYLEMALQRRRGNPTLRNDLGVALLASGSALNSWRARNHFYTAAFPSEQIRVGEKSRSSEDTDTNTNNSIDPENAFRWISNDLSPSTDKTKPPLSLPSSREAVTAYWNLQLIDPGRFHKCRLDTATRLTCNCQSDPWEAELLRRPMVSSLYRSQFFAKLETYLLEVTIGVSSTSARNLSPLRPPPLTPPHPPQNAPATTWLREYIEAQLLLRWSTAILNPDKGGSVSEELYYSDIQTLLALQPTSWAPDLRAAINETATAKPALRRCLADAHFLYAKAARVAADYGIAAAGIWYSTASVALQSCPSSLERRVNIRSILAKIAIISSSEITNEDLTLLSRLAQESIDSKEYSNATLAFFGEALLRGQSLDLKNCDIAIENGLHAAKHSGDHLLTARFLSMRAQLSRQLGDRESFITLSMAGRRIAQRFSTSRDLLQVPLPELFLLQSHMVEPNTEPGLEPPTISTIRYLIRRATHLRQTGRSEMACLTLQGALSSANRVRRSTAKATDRLTISELLQEITTLLSDIYFYDLHDIRSAIAISDLSRAADLRDRACSLLVEDCALHPLINTEDLQERLSPNLHLVIVLKMPTGNQTCLLSPSSLSCWSVSISAQDIRMMSHLLLQQRVPGQTKLLIAQWLHEQLFGNLLQNLRADDYILLSLPAELQGVPFAALEPPQVPGAQRLSTSLGVVPSIKLLLAPRANPDRASSWLVVTNPPLDGLPSLPQASEGFEYLPLLFSETYQYHDTTPSFQLIHHDLTRANNFVYSGHSLWLDYLLAALARQPLSLSHMESVTLLACSPGPQERSTTEIQWHAAEFLAKGSRRVRVFDAIIPDDLALGVFQQQEGNGYLKWDSNLVLQTSTRNNLDKMAVHRDWVSTTWTTYLGSMP